MRYAQTPPRLFDASGPKQSYLLLGAGTQDRSFDGVLFEDETFFDAYFEFQPTAELFLAVTARVADAIDFSNTRPGDELVLAEEEEPPIEIQIERLEAHMRDAVAREREANQRLRQVDKLKDEFLANTSHELRTPLYGITGLAESLIDGGAGELPENARSHLAMSRT